MKEWIKKFFGQLRSLWSKWTFVQRIVFVVIFLVVSAAFVILVLFSSVPTHIPLFGSSLQDDQARNRITIKLDEEGVDYEVGSDGKIYVKDLRTARRMRSLLIREDLVPLEMDPWALFDVERWTLTDFERNVNLQRALTANLEQHLESLRDIDSADVTLVFPERTLFSEDQKPATASIVITPRPGSDIEENRKKIEGIVKLVQFAVEGLEEENITIADHKGLLLNDFVGLEGVDRLELARRILRQKRALEAQYIQTVRQSLQRVFSQKRVDIINIDIDLEFVKKQVQTEEHYPITMRSDDPLTPYSELEVKPSLTISRTVNKENFEGTGFNPEGPPGQEGQTPPAYKDLSNLVGKYNKDSLIENEVVNTKNINEEKNPFQVNRLTVAVAVDGVWNREYGEKGKPIILTGNRIKRSYVPVSPEDLQKAQTLVEHAVGYNPQRGDAVTVQHIPFDQTERFLTEDQRYFRRQQIRLGILVLAIGLAALFVMFILYRIISHSIERRRRLKAEELARQQRLLREAALQEADQMMEGDLSIEGAQDRLQESAMNAARENPEEVAQLVRTWIAEE